MCLDLIPFPTLTADSKSQGEEVKESRTVLWCGLRALSHLHMHWDFSSAPGALTACCEPGHVFTYQGVVKEGAK